jgi:hypothetical protein
MASFSNALQVRPYQLIRILAGIGAGRSHDLGNARLNAILNAVREDPSRPVTLRCNVDTMFRYQNIGRKDDTPGGKAFNDRRDLHVLQRLGLCPGDTRPAVTLFERVIAQVDARSVADMECEDVPPSARWPRGQAISTDYEKGCKLGLAAVLAWRSDEDMAWVKAASAQQILDAHALSLRPHHLLCMSCFYGSARNRNQPLVPIDADNLFETIDAIRRNPEIPITLISGPCMICPPCPLLHPATNRCIGGAAMALRDQKKDLDVLQRLDLEYGDTLPARQLFYRLYAQIASTTDICGHHTGQVTAPEWRVCGGLTGDPGYVRAREEKLGLGVLLYRDKKGHG